MNYKVINRLISESFYKGNKTYISKNKGTVGITIDRFVVWFIPDHEFIFDIDKLDIENINLERYINTDGYSDVIRSNVLIEDYKKQLRIFENDDTRVYVDSKLLKGFDMNISTFKIKNEKLPVLIYENDELVGLVLPTRLNRKGE